MTHKNQQKGSMNSIKGSKKMKCSKCGAENKDDASFCERCGAKLKKSSKSKKRGFWWNKQSKKTKILIVAVGIALITLIFVSTSYSSYHPNEGQYQDKVFNWKSDLDSVTQMGAEGVDDGTDSDYVVLYNKVANHLSDMEDDINETQPPKSYETFHVYLLNEVDNFKMGYQAKAMSKKTGEKGDDDPQLKESIIYFNTGHKYENLANQEERRIGF